MGVLSAGRPLTWKEIVEVRTLLKNDACNDLIKILRKHLQRKNDPFLWGDEVSGMITTNTCLIRLFRLNIHWFVLIMRINVYNC